MTYNIIGIYNSSTNEFIEGVPYVYSSGWQYAKPFVYDSDWQVVGAAKTLMVPLFTSQSEQLITSDTKEFLVRNH